MDKRPTSPHIQIYRWNISSLTSIMHRMSGIALYFAVVAICWYIVYYAYQINIDIEREQCNSCSNGFLKFIFISAIVIITSALYYHFFNGIRHLFWDIGKGFDLDKAKSNGYIVISLAILATIATIVAAFYLRIY